jgi:hypothetical protein
MGTENNVILDIERGQHRRLFSGGCNGTFSLMLVQPWETAPASGKD